MNRLVSLRFSLGSAFALAVTITAIVLGAATYFTIRYDARETLRKELGHLAGTIAGGIDAEAHAGLLNASDMESPAYLRIRTAFRKILKANPDIRFIYTFRVTSEGKTVFVVDSADLGPDFSPLGSEVDVVGPLMAATLKQPYPISVEANFDTDRYGTWLSAYAPIPKGNGASEAGVGVDIAASRVLEMEKRYLFLIGTITLIIAVSGVFCGLLLSRQISRPLLKLSADMQKIQVLILEKVEVKSRIKEIAMMHGSLDNMKKGLKSFKKYVPADIVTELISMRKEAVLETTKKTITVFFSDLENFTSISEKVGAEGISSMLSSYFDTMTGTLQARRATVDKYIGDSIMAFWGAPLPNEDHAFAACSAALSCRNALQELHARWKADGIPVMNTRIGINTGEAVVGNIGYSERLSYTALGNTINIASRLEGLNKYYGTNLLIGQETWKAVQGKISARLVDSVAAKGATNAIGIYELLCEGPVRDSILAEAMNEYAEGLAHYFERRWKEAIGRFGAVLLLKGEDGPARLMINRCEKFSLNPPAADWEGVTKMHYK